MRQTVCFHIFTFFNENLCMAQAEEGGGAGGSDPDTGMRSGAKTGSGLCSGCSYFMN